MLRVCIIAASLALAAGPVLAQTADTPGNEPVSAVPTNVGPGDTHTLWSPKLPAPPVSPDSPAVAFVKAAQTALAAGHLGEAQEAIERAESRALDRSIVPSNLGQPSQQPLVQQLAQAREMLARGDKTGAMTLLSQAAANPEAMATD